MKYRILLFVAVAFVLMTACAWAQMETPEPPPVPQPGVEAEAPAPEAEPVVEGAPTEPEALKSSPLIPFTVQQLIQVPKEIRVSPQVNCSLQNGEILFCYVAPKPAPKAKE